MERHLLQRPALYGVIQHKTAEIACMDGERAGARYRQIEFTVGTGVTDGNPYDTAGLQLWIVGKNGQAKAAGDQIGDGAILPHTAGDDGIQSLRREQVFDIVSLID